MIKKLSLSLSLSLSTLPLLLASGLKSHMQNSGISNNLQSVYKSGNSKETALSYIQNDILSAQDRGERGELLFRSWIFLRFLTRSIMTSCSVDLLSGLALMVWCCSGFDPTWPVVLSLLKSMVYNGVLSTPQYCSIITTFGKHHLYVDYTQIYTSFVEEDITQSLIVVQNCMLTIQVWMNQNMLKLNPSETEFMIICNLTQREKVGYFPSWTSEPKFCRNRLHTKPGCFRSSFFIQETWLDYL